MKRGLWLLLIVAAVLLLWRWTIYRGTPEPGLAHAAGTATPPAGFVARSSVPSSTCRPPAYDGRAEEPAQRAIPDDLAAFRHGDGTLLPLAGFSVDARVLSTRRYSADREADYAPIDLALGWNRMREDAVLAQLEISQSGRWYFYRWQGDPPIPAEEIRDSSANMHMIPSDRRIAKALDEVEEGQRVRISGWLVEVQAPDGWRWRSSTSRSDSGAGGCEVVYVCKVEVE